MHMQAMLAALCGCLLGASGQAREALRLKSGYVLEAAGHEQHGDVLEVRLGTGSLQIPVAEVEAIDVLPEIAVEKPAAVATPEQMLRDAALRQGIEAAFVRSVAMVESGMRQTSVSRKGAMGLMQLMPGTAEELHVDASKADDNALGGAMYLRKLLLAYKGNSGLALAAYNAGPGAVKRYGGVPPYRETRLYILKVLKEYERQIRAQPKVVEASAAPVAATGISTPTATN